VAQVLVHLSQLVADQAEITELDINPLLADAAGVIALDARIRARPAAQPGARRLAIRPYPKELESEGRLQDGTPLHLRPVRPEDEPALIALVERMAPADLRMRFFTPMKSLTHELAAKLTQIDYDREVALVAEPPGGGEILGVARFSADPDGVRAEYAIVVRSDLKGHGLGYLLMVRLMAVAKARGLQELFGNVLRQNEPMLAMASELGFETTNHPEEPDVVLVTKRL
jgi:acetyltransferase